jgi:hypothetical protein|tara:strand:- start:3264 stop:4640 length:1377 start_codon:yes stop_codon:yes gene_type:complete
MTRPSFLLDFARIFLFTGIILGVSLLFSGCGSRDKEPPSVQLISPAFDGLDVQFGDILFVQFTGTDNRADGGIWKVELRKGDGVSVRTAQIGLWQGSGIDTLVVPFVLDAPSWPTETMTLALIVDDAAGNRGAVFRDIDYTAASDVPNSLVALTEEVDGTSSLLVYEDESGIPNAAEGLPLSHDLAYANDRFALADASAATVHVVDRASMAIETTWNSSQSSGSLPLVRRVHALGLQAGFTIVHASGIAIINTSGGLLFERFSDAPWTPVDARFSGNTCVLWEKNEATSAHRLRSWNFITGGSGPIVNLAVAPDGIGAVPAQTSGSEGSIFVINETTGLTLVNVSTGTMDDLCGLIGSGEMPDSEYASVGFDGNQALFVRGSQLCRQEISPVSSGSNWPFIGEITDLRSRPDGSSHMLLSEGEGESKRLVTWSSSDAAPVENEMNLPINTKAIWVVED